MTVTITVTHCHCHYHSVTVSDTITVTVTVTVTVSHSRCYSQSQLQSVSSVSIRCELQTPGSVTMHLSSSLLHHCCRGSCIRRSLHCPHHICVCVCYQWRVITLQITLQFSMLGGIPTNGRYTDHAGNTAASMAVARLSALTSQQLHFLVCSLSLAEW